METTKQATTAKTAQEQGAETVPQRKGGFVQGAAVAQGCCGETGGSSGCCGTAAQVVVPISTVQPASEAGCCGTAARIVEPASTVQPASEGGCCGAAKTETTSSSRGCC